jgi:hypothetical protein
MKLCSSCQDTSPNDARFCITCGHSFAVTGVTERMTSAGAQTMRLEGGTPRWTGPGSTSIIATSDGRTFSVGTVFVPVEYNWTLRSSYGWAVMSLGSAPIYTKVQP